MPHCGGECETGERDERGGGEETISAGIRGISSMADRARNLVSASLRLRLRYRSSIDR